MKSRNLTIGDAISKTHVFRSPNSIRRTLSQRNLLTINHFQDVLSTHWRKHAKTEIQHGIFFNKVLSELIREAPELGYILRAWYLYGVDIVKPNHTQTLQPPTIKELAGITGFTTEQIAEYDKRILAIAAQYDCNATAWHWERKQYESHQNDLYLAKLNLQQALSGKNPTVISEALSDLYLQILLKQSVYREAAPTMLSFLDTAKLVVLTNSGIPDQRRFQLAFEKSWRHFASINLSLTADGDERDHLQAYFTPQDKEDLRGAAITAINNLARDIKHDNKITITPSPMQRAMLRHHE